jgi:hypothetical protein
MSVILRRSSPCESQSFVRRVGIFRVLRRGNVLPYQFYDVALLHNLKVFWKQSYHSAFHNAEGCAVAFIGGLCCALLYEVVEGSDFV